MRRPLLILASAVLATLPLLVVLFVPSLPQNVLLAVLFVAALVVSPIVNARIDPARPRWTARTAMTSTGRVWRMQAPRAVMGLIAVAVVFGIGQGAAYGVAQALPTAWALQQLVAYLVSYVLGAATYLGVIRNAATARASRL